MEYKNIFQESPTFLCSLAKIALLLVSYAAMSTRVSYCRLNDFIPHSVSGLEDKDENRILRKPKTKNCEYYLRESKKKTKLAIPTFTLREYDDCTHVNQRRD